MDWPFHNQMTLKRPYPFGNEDTQPQYEETSYILPQYDATPYVHPQYEETYTLPQYEATPYTQPQYEGTPSASNLTQIDEPLCLLGSVVNVNAQLRRPTGEFFPCPPFLTATGPSVALSVSLVGDYFELLDQGRAFARLEKGFCSEARRLVDFGVEFQACLDWTRWDNFRRAWIPYSTRDDMATFVVDINVYSRIHHADKVGSILLRSGIFLQRPVHNFGRENYYNPQILEFDGFQEKPDEVMSERDETPAPVVVPNLPAPGDPKPSTKSPDYIERILNCLSHAGILNEIRTDTSRIKSELMGHQMTALDFIAHRESGKPPAELSFWRERRANGRIYFHHVLTKAKAPECLETRGGIIADDMGLGKSLTILSAIASSLDDAAAFASTWKESPTALSTTQDASPATLVIVPSTILIDNWIEEIRTHTYPHKVTFHKHLGTDRHSELHLLLEKNIVFTTFATALEDTKQGQSPLSKIHWFRIVLDEAHKIRNRTTKQFQAVQQLSAQRRWCLTGTPIQNRLEDLGSLVAFLRVPDLEQVSTFRRCIITPTLPDRGSQFQNLQLLLKTICLRRTREILGMPEPSAQPRPLDFSIPERRQYDELYEHYKRRVQMAVSGVSKVTSTTLQSIHELRLFCNNGLRKTKVGIHDSDDEMLSYFQQLGQDMCAKCSLPIFCIDQVGERNGGIFIPSCKHLVCHSCLPQCLNKKRACQLCASGNAPPDLTDHIGTEVPTSATDETAFQYPSKLSALLHDIQMEPGHKCIVFSSWKKTLDLAGELFKRANIKYDIIHGGLSLKQRLRALKDFKSILGPNILMMTLGTGAEGLNLTIASRIYLLEPQWNPFLELQAMARAQRIGQTKQVVCIRYVMNKTIEQSDVLNRQQRKTALAGGGFKEQKMNDSLADVVMGPALVVIPTEGIHGRGGAIAT